MGREAVEKGEIKGEEDYCVFISAKQCVVKYKIFTPGNQDG